MEELNPTGIPALPFQMPSNGSTTSNFTFNITQMPIPQDNLPEAILQNPNTTSPTFNLPPPPQPINQPPNFDFTASPDKAIVPFTLLNTQGIILETGDEESKRIVKGLSTVQYKQDLANLAARIGSFTTAALHSLWAEQDEKISSLEKQIVHTKGLDLGMRKYVDSNNRAIRTICQKIVEFQESLQTVMNETSTSLVNFSDFFQNSLQNIVTDATNSTTQMTEFRLVSEDKDNQLLEMINKLSCFYFEKCGKIENSIIQFSNTFDVYKKRLIENENVITDQFSKMEKIMANKLENVKRDFDKDINENTDLMNKSIKAIKEVTDNCKNTLSKEIDQKNKNLEERIINIFNKKLSETNEKIAKLENLYTNSESSRQNTTITQNKKLDEFTNNINKNYSIIVNLEKDINLKTTAIEKLEKKIKEMPNSITEYDKNDEKIKIKINELSTSLSNKLNNDANGHILITKVKDQLAETIKRNTELNVKINLLESNMKEKSELLKKDPIKNNNSVINNEKIENDLKNLNSRVNDLIENNNAISKKLSNFESKTALILNKIAEPNNHYRFNLHLQLSQSDFKRLKYILKKTNMTYNMIFENSYDNNVNIHLQFFYKKDYFYIKRRIRFWKTYIAKRNDNKSAETIQNNKENAGLVKIDNNAINISSPLRKFFLSLDSWQIHYCRGDGNCAFRAAAYLLYGNQNEHGKLRHLVADYLEKEEAHFKKFMPTLEISYKDYVNKIRANATWGDDIELAAISEMFTKKIEIYRRNGKFLNLLNTCNEQIVGNGEPLRLLYSGNHYDAIFPRAIPNMNNCFFGNLPKWRPYPQQNQF